MTTNFNFILAQNTFTYVNVLDNIVFDFTIILMGQVDEIRSGMNDKLHKWEEQSKELISTFIHRFGGNRIEQMLTTSRERIARAISPTPSRHRHSSHFWL